MRKLLALSYVILVAGFACLAHAQLTQTGAGKVAGGGGGGGGDFTSNLIHFWPMTDAQVVGTQITDTVGTGTNNGTSSDAVIHVVSGSGPNGTYTTARALDGSGTITLTNPLFNWNSGSFTWTGWLKVTSNNSTGSGSTSQRFINCDNLGDGTNQFQVLMLVSPPGTILALTNATRANITSGSTLVNGTWAHLAVVNSGGGTGGTMTIYFNGATAAQTAGSASSSFGISSAFFGTGDGANGDMTGSLSAFRLYNRALSATDISALFAAGG